VSTDNWRKSSYSPNAANCVYVATGDNHTVRLRESDAPGVTLAATSATFGVFIRAVKAGEFDRLTPR
jgi:CYTH domain-containing protein